LVILLKKLKHDRLVKFWVRPESNGCGNGVGRVGGVAGIVGRDVEVDVVEVVDGLVEGVDDGKPDATDVDAASSVVASVPAANGCRL